MLKDGEPGRFTHSIRRDRTRSSRCPEAEEAHYRQTESLVLAAFTIPFVRIHLDTHLGIISSRLNTSFEGLFVLGSCTIRT
jgi:hypothetical protein